MIRFRNMYCRQRCNVYSWPISLNWYFFVRVNIWWLETCNWCILCMYSNLFDNTWTNSLFRAEECSGEGGNMPRRLRFSQNNVLTYGIQCRLMLWFPALMGRWKRCQRNLVVYSDCFLSVAGRIRRVRFEVNFCQCILVVVVVSSKKSKYGREQRTSGRVAPRKRSQKVAAVLLCSNTELLNKRSCFY